MRITAIGGVRLLVLFSLLSMSTAVLAASAPSASDSAVGPEVSPSVLPDSIPLTTSPVSTSIPSNEIRITGVGNGSMPWTIIVLLTFLTLIPSLLLCMTPFARLLVVFHFLRQALGLQTTPTNQTLIGLALVLTFFLMQPVGANIYETSVVPLESGRINAMQAVERGAGPIRQFMLHYVREKDVALFVELSKEPRPRSRGFVDAHRGTGLHPVGAKSRLSDRDRTVSSRSWPST